MKVYKITFNKYTNYMRDAVSNGESYLSLQQDNKNDDGYLMVMTNNIGNFIDRMKVNEYGKGIKLMEYIGEGFIDDGKGGIQCE